MTRRILIQTAIAMSLFAVFVSVSGCGGSGKCSVSGKVTFKGKPVYGGVVTLMNDKDAPAMGAIDFEGNYKVDNAPTGKVRIGVVSQKPQAPRDRGGDRMKGTAVPGAGDPTKWFTVDEKYADPNSSGKEMTLKGGANTINIDLE